MNRLHIPAGGMPFTGDDLLYMQNGLTQGIEAAIKPLLGDDDHGVLEGGQVLVTGGQIRVFRGWFVINGQIARLASELTIASTDAAQYALYIEETYDIDGRDTFADGVGRDTYVVPRVNYRAAGTDPNDLPLDRVNGLRLDIRGSQPQVADISTSNVRLSYYKNNGIVHLSGEVLASTSGLIGTFGDVIPAQLTRAAAFTSVVFVSSVVELNTNGELSVLGNSIPVGSTFSMTFNQ